MTRISDVVTKIPIADVATGIAAVPAPIIIPDTCNLLSLFRRRSDGAKWPTPAVGWNEVRAARDLLDYAITKPSGQVHFAVPDLVVDEYDKHADNILQEYEQWVDYHDRNQEWVDQAIQSFDLPPLSTPTVRSLDLHGRLRKLADDLLTNSFALERDPVCNGRALERLFGNMPPSHRDSQIKDSINLEQSIELCDRLRSLRFAGPVIFISSNTKDYAEEKSGRIHPALQPDFDRVSLEYFTAFEYALGWLKSRGHVP